jgi:hypothetical protein
VKYKDEYDQDSCFFSRSMFRGGVGTKHQERERPEHVGGAVVGAPRPVREICIIVHVGGTRCVTSSTDHYMKIHARITLTVEFIRGYICIFLFDV